MEFKRFLFHSRRVGVMTVFPVGLSLQASSSGMISTCFHFPSLVTFGSEMNGIKLANDRRIEISLIPFLVQVMQRENSHIFL